MGQYYLVINLDKKEYLYPHAFGDGLKLCEFGCSAEGTLFGLTVLLADGNGRGGGDYFWDEKGECTQEEFDAVIGRWKGDRIIISGDYADPLPGEELNLYSRCNNPPGVEPYSDISTLVAKVICATPGPSLIRRVSGNSSFY
jgi:hypothetical protein